MKWFLATRAQFSQENLSGYLLPDVIDPEMVKIIFLVTGVSLLVISLISINFSEKREVRQWSLLGVVGAIALLSSPLLDLVESVSGIRINENLRLLIPSILIFQVVVLWLLKLGEKK